MNSLMGKSFKSSQCKTHLRLAAARIKLLRNKRESQIKVLKREIAGLLQSGQESSASIRVEHVIREQNIIEAYDTIEIFAELVAIRLPIIDSQKICPPDLKEAISSLVFASPRCVDLPELAQIRTLFQSKYGKDFIAAATELHPNCGVNRRVIEKLSIRNPTMETKFKLMKEIAIEYNVEWDTGAFEKEVVKIHEDLLDGPRQFASAHEMPMLSNSKEELPKPIIQPSSINSTSLPNDPVPYVHVQRSPPRKYEEANPDVKDQPSSLEGFNTVVRDAHPKNEFPSKRESDMFLPQVSAKNENPRRHSLGFVGDQSRREDGSVSQVAHSQDQIRDSKRASIGVPGEKDLQDHHRDADSVAKATTFDSHRTFVGVSVAMSLANTDKYLQSSDSSKQRTRPKPPQTALGDETDGHDGYSHHENQQEHENYGEESVQLMRNQVSRSNRRNSKSQSSPKMRSDLHKAPQFDDDDDLNRGPCGVLDDKISTHDFEEDIGKSSYQRSKLGKNSEPLVHDSHKSTSSQSQKLDAYKSAELHEFDNFSNDEHTSWEKDVGKTMSKPSLDVHVTSTSRGSHDFEEALTNKGSWGRGSDKVRLKDDTHQHNDSHIPHESASMETHALEGSHGQIGKGNDTKILVGESHNNTVARSPGFDEDRDQASQWDEEPHERGTPIMSKSLHDMYDHAPLWDDEPHGKATMTLNLMSSHREYDDAVKGSHIDHHGRSSGGSSEDEHPTTFKHGGRGHKDGDRQESRARFERYKKRDDPSHGSEDDAIILTRKGPSLRKSKAVDNDPKRDAHISHGPSYDQEKMPTLQEVDSLSGTIGRRRESQVGRTKISHLEKKPTSHDTPLFDEQEDDFGAALHVGNDRIVKPTFDEFYKGESTRYVDDPFMKGIRLQAMDLGHLRPPRTPKYDDEGDDFEGNTFNSSYRTKQERYSEKNSCYLPHFSRDSFDNGESASGKHMSLRGDLPYEKAKHESSRAKDTTSGHVERHTGQRLIVGGDELRADIRDGDLYVQKTRVNVSRVVDDSQQFEDVEQSQGRKKSEGKRLPNSRSKAKDTHLHDHKIDYWSKETSAGTDRRHESPQGTSAGSLEYKDHNSYVGKSRVDVSRAVDDSQQFEDVEQSQGRKKSEGNRLSNSRPKARDTHLEHHKMDYQSTETSARANRHHESIHGASTNLVEYEDHNAKRASNLPKLNVRKQGNLQDVAYHEDIHTPSSRTSQPSRVEKSLKVGSSSGTHKPVQHTPQVTPNVPLPKASSDSLGPQKVSMLQDLRRTQSATKDDAPNTPKSKPKLIKPPDLNDFLAKFNKR